jgi:hypothetical protein
MAPPASRSSAARVQRRRDKLRAAGLRPVQIWVPDVRRPGFAEECRRQSRALRGDPHETEILSWLEAVADTDGWTA